MVLQKTQAKIIIIFKSCFLHKTKKQKYIIMNSWIVRLAATGNNTKYRKEEACDSIQRSKDARSDQVDPTHTFKEARKHWLNLDFDLFSSISLNSNSDYNICAFVRITDYRKQNWSKKNRSSSSKTMKSRFIFKSIFSSKLHIFFCCW